MIQLLLFPVLFLLALIAAVALFAETKTLKRDLNREKQNSRPPMPDWTFDAREAIDSRGNLTQAGGEL